MPAQVCEIDLILRFLTSNPPLGSIGLHDWCAGGAGAPDGADQEEPQGGDRQGGHPGAELGQQGQGELFSNTMSSTASGAPMPRY